MGAQTSDLWNGKQREVEAGQLPRKTGLVGEALPLLVWGYPWLSRLDKLQTKWLP